MMITVTQGSDISLLILLDNEYCTEWKEVLGLGCAISECVSLKCIYESAGNVIVYQERERAANDLLCCLHKSLKSFLLCYGAASGPYCDAVCQQALDQRAVKSQ